MSETLKPSAEAEKTTQKSPWDTLTELPPFEEHIKHVQERINAAYAKLERRNVDQQKRIIESRTISDPGLAGDTVPIENPYADFPTSAPSTAKQAQRLIFDKFNLTPRDDKYAQRYEASKIATEELNQERDRQRVDQILESTEKSIATDIGDILKQQEQEKIEHQKDLEMLLEGMDNYRQDKIEGRQAERHQELTERAFNAALTDFSEIDGASKVEGSGVEKREIEYNGKNLTVYDMKGYPFAFIQHAIDFKGQGEDSNAWRIGATTAKNLQDNPELWDRPRSDASIGEGAESAQSSDTISGTYIDTSSRWMSALNVGEYVYGFSSLEPGSLIRIYDEDGGTKNDLGESRANIDKKLDMPDKLGDSDSVEENRYYNEMLIRRYNEAGQPKRPDFMIVRDGQIPDITKKHAAHFDIPIINIETAEYQKAEEAKLNNLLDQYDPNSGYPTTKKLLDEVSYSWVVRHREGREDVGKGSSSADAAGLATDQVFARNISPDLQAKIRNFENLELEKRLDYIADQVTRATEEARQSTASGETYYGFNHGIYRAEDRYYGKEISSGVVGSTSNIVTNIEVPGEGRIETTIYDGEHPAPGDSMRPGASSIEYNKLRPIVQAYEATIAENKQKIAETKPKMP